MIKRLASSVLATTLVSTMALPYLTPIGAAHPPPDNPYVSGGRLYRIDLSAPALTTMAQVVLQQALI